MDVRERMDADLKTAMREKNELARDTLRMLMSNLKNRRIELGRELEEGEVLAVLQKAVKTRKESAEQYAAAGRDELATKENAEIEVVAQYLPQGMSEDEMRAAVKAAIAETGAASKADLGKVMKAVMAKSGGRADGKVVSRLAGEELG